MPGTHSAARRRQALLIATFLPLCWLAMQVVHESGHVLGAWLGGGSVERVVLPPLGFSRTELRENPHALLEVWSGPLLGATLPLLLALAWRHARLPAAHLPRFFAGFCLVANGAYLGLGAATGDGDAGQLLDLGTPAWLLLACALPALAGGLRCWHGLGPAFGFGNGGQRVRALEAAISAVLLALTIAVERWSAGSSS